MNIEAAPEFRNGNGAHGEEADIREEGNSREREPGFNLKFYVTDHSADNPDTGSPEKLRALYADVKKDGIQSIRYDWHWRNVEPEPGEWSGEHLARYGKAGEVMREVGLESPTIILSNPPEWAVKLYKEDKEKFFDAWRNYVQHVKDSLQAAKGEKVKRVQVLNELNNAMYTPVAAEDLPRLCEITREVFHNYNPDIKLMATVHAGNVGEFASKAGFGTGIKEYLGKLEKMKDDFDVIAVDYYPGLWHLPLAEANWKLKDIFKQIQLLKEAFEEIATWGKEYELGEIGLPTNSPWSDEKRQRYFYDSFFRAYKQLLLDFRERGIALPSSVGFYEAMDEPPESLKGKVLRRLTPFPEHDMGMRRGGGEKKMILGGSPHARERGEEMSGQLSQLGKIMRYLRAPMRKAEKEDSSES